MRWNFYYRRQNNDPTRNLDRPCDPYTFEIDTDDPVEAIDYALEHGVRQGDYASGIVEIQNDLGVYRARDNKRVWSKRTGKVLVLRAATEFKSWEQLEAEEKLELVAGQPATSPKEEGTIMAKNNNKSTLAGSSINRELVAQALMRTTPIAMLNHLTAKGYDLDRTLAAMTKRELAQVYTTIIEERPRARETRAALLEVIKTRCAAWLRDTNGRGSKIVVVKKNSNGKTPASFNGRDVARVVEAEPLPQPSPEPTAKKKPAAKKAAKATPKGDAKNVQVVDGEPTSPLHFQCPRSLRGKLADKAAELGLSRSDLLRQIVERAIDAWS